MDDADHVTFEKLKYAVVPEDVGTVEMVKVAPPAVYAVPEASPVAE